MPPDTEDPGAAYQLPRARGGAQRRRLRSGSGSADEGGLDRHLPLDAPPRERDRHDGAHRRRPQVPPGRLRADQGDGAPLLRERPRTSTFGRWSPISARTPTSRCRRMPSSASTSRTCTLLACACAWRRSGGRRCRPSTAPGYDHNWVRVYKYPGRCCAAAAEGHHPAPDRLLRQLPDEPERGRPAQLVRFGPPVGGQHVHQPDPGRLHGRRGVRGRGRRARGPADGRRRGGTSDASPAARPTTPRSRTTKTSEDDGAQRGIGGTRHRGGGARGSATRSRPAVVRERAEHRPGLRGMGAERGRLLQPRLRLHEPELGGSDRRARRCGQRHRAGRTRPGAADAFPPRGGTGSSSGFACPPTSATRN